jgi:adenine-specific DNA-methyltransferase
MPTTSDLKHTISECLTKFNQTELKTAAFALFAALGYQSDKRLDIQPNTSSQFLANFDQAGKLNQKNAWIPEWLSVDFLFQITDDEIQSALKTQSLLFQNRQVDDRNIKSYVFVAIQLSGEHYTRTQLAAITREVNKLFPMPVMILFKHGQALTLSIIARRLHKREVEKDVLEKVTLIKDISCSHPHRAHIEILFDLSIEQLSQRQPIGNFVDLQKAWEKTLDTTELNKKFFREVANWYFWALQNVTFPKGAGQEVENRNATSAIRLITRLIFVWFLKEKGLVADDLFSKHRLDEILNYTDAQGSTYYKAILQNLFFATLNQEMNTPGKRDRRDFRKDGRQHYNITTLYRYQAYFKNPDQALKLFENIPFLNGGLFECLDKPDKDDPDKILRIDGFSDRADSELVVPDVLFFSDVKEIDLNEIYDTRNKRYKVRGLIRIFDSYKFTIEENTPIEEEIALDPELLGKVFENLLAAFNPETGTTARKQTGSFYTPREIVNYMVDEALMAYLEGNLSPTPPLQGEGQETRDKLRHLLAYNNQPDLFSEEEEQRLISAIDVIKVLDPACGSGAFPMGVLHKLVFILTKLDPGNVHWKERQITKASEIPDTTVREKVMADIEQAFGSNELDYGRKLYLIENCIYGVDIQPIAVQIAKLRFFISLVVDQRIDDLKENRGIRPLPNLETKFVAANTLIGIEKPAQLMFHNAEIERKEKQLAEVRVALFTARTPATKRKYREQDAKLRTEIAALLKSDGWGSQTAAQLAGWDPYDQNSSAGFFDPDWMFGIVDGFDVVIGNPPYLESRHPAFNESLKDKYQASVKRRWGDDSKFITRGSDLLIYFFENAIFNIKKNGCVVFITQNSWLDTEYGKKFQSFLLKNTKVHKVVDSDFRYFQSGDGPNINTVVTLFIGKKASGSNAITFARYHENFRHVSIANLNLAGQQDANIVDVKNFQYSDTLLRELKWGILLSSSYEILKLFPLLNKKAKRLDEIRNSNLSFGQGFNLTKDYFVTSDILSTVNFAIKAAIPIHTSSDGAVFDIKHTAQFILDKSKLSKQEVFSLKSRGITVFDPKSTSKKPPKLIMPRGISRHYCAMNSNSCYSSSGVEIYDDSDTASEELIFNLWLFLNSSTAWLLREISGRKNLGGGMLKAEAVDLETIPVYMDFRKPEEIKMIFHKIKDRQVMTTVEEIDTDEHKQIDQIVFDYLDLSEDLQKNIIDTLKSKIIEREKKSTT